MSDMLVNLIERIKLYGLEEVFSRYYSVYRAQVVDNADDEHRGRIKVKIPVLFGDLPMPNWVLPKAFRNAGPQKGEFYPPKIDDWVFVEFEGGNSHFPIYVGGWHGETEEGSELPEYFKHDDEDKPLVRGYVDPIGNRILFDETPEKEQIQIVASNVDKKELQFLLSLEKEKEFIKLLSLYHKLILDDTKDKEEITLEHKSGTKVYINPKGTTTISTINGNQIVIDEEKNIIDLKTKEGAEVKLEKNIVINDSAKKTTVTISADGLTIKADKDLKIESKIAAIKANEISFNGGNAKMSMKSAKIAMGTSSCEIVESMIGIIDAFLNAPSLVPTGVGPSGPLLPPAKVELTLIKTKLNAIKGSL